MAFYQLDSQPGAMSADIYERPAVIAVTANHVDTLEERLNEKLGDAKAAGRVLGVSEIRAVVASDIGDLVWYATIVWCKKRQIETGIPADQDEDGDEPSVTVHDHVGHPTGYIDQGGPF